MWGQIRRKIIRLVGNHLTCWSSFDLSIVIWLVSKIGSGVVAVIRMLEDSTYVMYDIYHLQVKVELRKNSYMIHSKTYVTFARTSTLVLCTSTELA